MDIYLDKKQKILAVSLVVLGFFVFFFWYIDLKRDLNLSLVYSARVNNDSANEEKSSICDGEFCNANDVQIKIQDTDEDGISDYDELNIYGTFPYISDTDSDGISDGDEIKNGTDPKCPKGEKCGIESAVKNSDGFSVSNNKSLEILKSFDFDSIKISDEMAGGDQMNEIMNGEASIEEIKDMLKQAGVEKGVINSLSDEVLLQGYKSVLNSDNNEFDEFDEFDEE